MKVRIREMMENLKEALEYMVELGEDRVNVVEIDGTYYTDKRLTRIDENTDLDCLSITTLSGLVDYIKSNVDNCYKSNLLVVVKSPTEVSVERGLDVDGKRRQVAQIKALVPRIGFDNYYDTESFNILLQSAFVDSTHRAILLKVVGNIKEEVIQNIGDDGISQAATIKTGVATVEDVKVPNPVILTPRRTFVEVEQPESQFVFRMQSGPRCALFEADGGAWRNEAMLNIKKYLESNLEGVQGITIIS